LFRVDLTKIEGVEDFPCPKCGTFISPDDLTKKVYTLLSIEGNDNNPQIWSFNVTSVKVF